MGLPKRSRKRRESSGGHFREDFPEKEAAFGQINVMVRKDPDGRMAVSRAQIPEMPAELKSVIDAMK